METKIDARPTWLLSATTRLRPESNRKVLVVEDEPDIQTLLCYQLRKQGYEVESASDGRAAWEMMQTTPPAVMVLDLMLPRMDGLSLLALMQQHPSIRNTQVIILSARTEESDVIKGLELGAHDYVRKPFQVKELIARVRSLLRRVQEGAGREVIERSPLRIEPESFRATLEGRPLPLTSMEFALLTALASHPLRVFSRNQLMSQAPEGSREGSGRNIDVHIRALRKKLSPHDSLIETVRGAGYRFRLRSEAWDPHSDDKRDED